MKTLKERPDLWLEERRLYDAMGDVLICGVDEAGAGPLAGPVYAAAVILPRELELPYLNDSKQLTEARRELLYPQIKEKAVAWAVATASPEEIDEVRARRGIDEAKQQLLAQAGEIWLFEHRTDPTKHRSRQAVWRDVKRAAEAMRLPQNVAPHSFRKVYAVDLMRKYGDIERVRRNLNHGGETVTTIYAMADLRLQQRQQLKAKRYGRR